MKPLYPSEQAKAKDDQIPLDGVMAEFREALNDEIEAATSSAASSAVPLINGKRIGLVGTFTHYAFTVESALMLPTDAQGDLHTQGRAPVAASVISIEGLAVTVSVSEDLGSFVPSARLQSDMVYLLRSLIRRIEDYGEQKRANPAGDRLLGAGEVHGDAVDLKSALTPELLSRLKGRRLNERQLDALASVLGRDTTFIWGPPGTGKTSTIGAIGECLYATNRSLLLVSHTNTAVDQALLRIGDAIDDEELRNGAVFRIGQPRDQRLAETEDLLLSTHVHRRSEEMVARREQLEASRAEKGIQLKALERLIELCVWVPTAKAEIAEKEHQLATLHGIEAEAVAAERRWQELDREAESNRELRKRAAEAVVVLDRSEDTHRHVGEAETELQRLAEAVMEAAVDLQAERDRLDQVRELEPLHERRRELPTYSEQERAVARAEREMRAATSVREEASQQLVKQEQVLDAAQQTGTLRRRLKGLPAPEEQEGAVSRAKEHLALVGKATEETVTALVEARSLMDEIEELGRALEPRDELGSVRDRQQAVEDRERTLSTLEDQQQALLTEAAGLGAKLAADEQVLQAFRAEYGEEPVALSKRLDTSAAAAAGARTIWQRLLDDGRRRQDELSSWGESRLSFLRECGLTIELKGESAEETVACVRTAHHEAAALAAQHDLTQLRSQIPAIEAEINHIAAEIGEINEALERVEQILISEAQVIGATLTKAYLDDRLQERSFDTVLLDEASMAPIPALWAAAGTASRSVVIVGDKQQLPPISHASDSEKHPEAPATRWLGRDVFTAAGATEKTPWLVQLTTQYRMKPAISALANELAYKGLLRDGDEIHSEGALGDWYRRDWGHDADLLLLDTESVGAWVTSVPRGGRASRLNFLSATVCVDLVREMLRSDRPPWRPGDHPRIIIVAPYRAHARLLGLMLREQKLEGEVEAGTVHNFQGSEAPVVIFDTVVDEPHWRVNLFMPSINEDIRRLLNVAITRAQSRLVLVGDFPYIHKLAKKAVLKDLIEMAEKRGSKVEAMDVLQLGLSARAARAQSLTEGSLKEDREAGRMITTQEAFFAKLIQDLDGAENRVVIYSPFMTQNRVGQMAPHIKAAIERGVRVYVITKTATAEERKRQVDTYRHIEASLIEWGVVVAHKRNMHEKVVLIDDEIVWTGSLNTLSFSDTQEVMERRKSAKIAADYIKTLRVNELLEPFDAEEARCPVCSEELVASEGNDEPFFWRCITPDCHSRSIGDPAPKDGRIVCRNCGEAVEFMDMPSGPHWRCVENKRHRQRVVRNHLKLPKMREIVAQRNLKKLDRSFGLDGSDKNGKSKQPARKATQLQGDTEDEARTVTAVELARRLGVDPRTFRAWLRRRARAGHELLADHLHNAQWEFSEAETTQLTREYREARSRAEAAAHRD